MVRLHVNGPGWPSSSRAAFEPVMGQVWANIQLRRSVQDLLNDTLGFGPKIYFFAPKTWLKCVKSTHDVTWKNYLKI